MITIEHVTKRFGRTAALSDVSLNIAAGDSVALWGSNGAGKTTLIRCVLGLLRSYGRISIGGCDVRRRGKDARMLMGYVPQELSFYDDLGVAEAVTFFARLKGLTLRSARQVLASVGLEADGHKRVRELSGGMKQRLALAIAMLGDPPVLVLDEVTASLDACGRSEFMAMLTQLSGAGRTLLFASHRVDEIAQLARRVVVLERGRVTATHQVNEFAAGVSVDSAIQLTIASSGPDLTRERGRHDGLNNQGLETSVCAWRATA